MRRLLWSRIRHGYGSTTNGNNGSISRTGWRSNWPGCLEIQNTFEYFPLNRLAIVSSMSSLLLYEGCGGVDWKVFQPTMKSIECSSSETDWSSWWTARAEGLGGHPCGQRKCIRQIGKVVHISLVTPPHDLSRIKLWVMIFYTSQR